MSHPSFFPLFRGCLFGGYLLLIAPFFSGCMLGPEHEPPAVYLPSQYSEAPDLTSYIDLTLWWSQFEDERLNELVEEALACNFDLAIALHRIEEFRAIYRIDRSILYPQIQGNFIAVRARRSGNIVSDVIETPNSPTELIPDDLVGPSIENFFQLGFDANWELDFFGKNRRRTEAAMRNFQAEQERFLNVQITLISDVARTYIDIRAFQQQIQARKEQIDRQAELLELTKVRFNAGLTSYLDVTRAEVALQAQEALLPHLEQGFGQALNALALLLGRPPEGFDVGEGVVPDARGRLPQLLPSDLLLRRPDIRQADRELAAATSRIGQAKAELFPSFSLLGTFGTQSNVFDELFVWPSRYWTIGPTMIWNLFTGGRLTAQIKIAGERQKQAILSYERAVNDALGDVEDRLIGYFREQEILDALEKELDAKREARTLTLDQYVSGLIPFDDVLSAEEDLFATQEAMLFSQGTQMVQLVGLYKALGGGWECSDMH